jgi:membrane protease YdiL (CAAX protease family)
VCVVAAFFAVMHWDATAPHAVPALFVLGLGLGGIYEKTGRLTAPIVMHMLFNAGNLVLAAVLVEA